MPLQIMLRFVFMMLSLCALGLGVYFLWNWYDGGLVRQADGDIVRFRPEWLLWAGIGLVGFSFLGRLLITPLLAGKDSDPTSPVHGAGTMVSSATGSRLYVEDLGKPGAAPIVFVHGWAMDSTIWFYAKRDLARNFRVLCWDLPGMGKSKPASPSAIGLTEFSRDLRTVIGLAGDQKVVLVGHSIGG